MNISEWLDKKEAEGIDVSHIVLPEDLAKEEEPNETIFLRKLDRAAFSAPAIIRLLPSSALETGIIAGDVKKRKVRTQPNRSGGSSLKTKTSRLKRQNHISRRRLSMKKKADFIILRRCAFHKAALRLCLFLRVNT
jgi:hypothetical protein